MWKRNVKNRPAIQINNVIAFFEFVNDFDGRELLN